MKKSTYHIIGLMSGTSLDGLDICYARYSYTNNWSFKIINAITVPYNHKWMNILKNLTNKSREEIDIVDFKYTNLLSILILDFIASFEITNIDAISSHGHTVLHKPSKGLTFQIGNLKLLSELTNHTCVCDFRQQDISLGGQGAPLVPVGDNLLFPEFKFCINLGGFCNISFSKSNALLAFDICPFNIGLNYYSKKLGFDFDESGSLSSSGEIIEPLLKRLNSLDYYNLSGPKSLGLEWVLKNVFIDISKYDYNPHDILRTLVEHSAIQISKILNKHGNGTVLLSGGGVKNSFFIDRLYFHSSSEFIIPETLIIDFKEALIFGFLGVLKLRNEINCVMSVTGASRNHSSGKVYEIFK